MKLLVINTLPWILVNPINQVSSPEEGEGHTYGEGLGPTNTSQAINRFFFPSITSWWENLHKAKVGISFPPEIQFPCRHSR